jgi:IS30 family transposase
LRQLEKHLLQVYPNLSPGIVLPLEVLFRSTSREPEDASLEPRRRARQLRAYETDAVVVRYREVRNIRIVAGEFRVSRTTVSRLLTSNRIDASRRMTEAQFSEAAELYERGLSSGVIGKQLGYHNHTMLRALRRRGVPIRAAAHRK